MAGDIPPGRPGNLTEEQEVKLREFWIATFNVFGVPLDGEESSNMSISDISSNGTKSYPGSTTDLPDKKKKRHLNPFSKKKRLESHSTGDLPEEEKESTKTASSTPTTDDKYGQNQAFDKAVQDMGPDEIRSAFWSMVKHDHPDGLLLRFLRARKWDINKALVMLISTMHWRAKEAHVDDEVVYKGDGGAVADLQSSDPAVAQEAKDRLLQLRMGKSFLHGTDKLGRPMCYVRARLHNANAQSESSLDWYTIYVIETARLLLHGNVDTATVVFDMSNFGLANMDYTPVKFMIKCFEANYPESLGIVLVHKAPWVFQGIWAIIKGWLDPVVAGKVHFTRSAEDLKNYIDAEHIPKELEGEEDWEYNYPEPKPEDDILMKNEDEKKRLRDERAVVVKEYERTTQAWIKTSPTDKAAGELQAKRNELAEKLRINHWATDPYIRARTMYDRQGVIQKDGTIEFYPKAGEGTVNGVAKDEENTPKPTAETSQDDVD
ncbi:MAG: hypothetical protein M1834_008846 [Cirrosporium novae-zelandiae]|nr:MAG: hypothetical protein M1834_008846 [Cirrosporium novae-zelandiae]